MNIQRKMTLAGLLALCLPAVAFAGDCQITLSQTVVDYHQLQRDNIVTTQQNWHKMPEREVNVNVFCPEQQQIGVLLQGAAGEKGRFMFGEKGGVAVKVDNMIIDGKNYNVGKTLDQVNLTPEGETASSLYLKNNETVVAVENNKVPTAQQMSFRVTVFPVLRDNAFRNTADVTQLESDLSWKILTH
ncbi:hypothetical protein V1599_00430 [Enterobacter sp. ECC-175]|uniref:hypothetical protein n=1 Tax=unclassified Enterobacter TaxID=2608935 RepID=UPI0015EB4C68|nr:hypothetical protein [Enterobacter sp. RIT 418]